eukprot:353635-Alexandrium_andersonii.AAC.1
MPISTSGCREADLALLAPRLLLHLHRLPRLLGRLLAPGLLGCRKKRSVTLGLQCLVLYLLLLLYQALSDCGQLPGLPVPDHEGQETVGGIHVFLEETVQHVGCRGEHDFGTEVRMVVLQGECPGDVDVQGDLGLGA